MTRFYPPLSWHHIHRAVQILVDCTTVLTTMTTQHNTTQHNTTQHGDEYNGTPCTSLPLPVDSTRTSEFNVTAHNDKLLDSSHYTTRNISTSQSLAHSCSDRMTDSSHIVICSGRQHCVAVWQVSPWTILAYIHVQSIQSTQNAIVNRTPNRLASECHVITIIITSIITITPLDC
jgi:hypothetical protein